MTSRRLEFGMRRDCGCTDRQTVWQLYCLFSC